MRRKVSMPVSVITGLNFVELLNSANCTSSNFIVLLTANTRKCMLTFWCLPYGNVSCNFVQTQTHDERTSFAPNFLANLWNKLISIQIMCVAWNTDTKLSPDESTMKWKLHSKQLYEFVSWSNDLSSRDKKNGKQKLRSNNHWFYHFDQKCTCILCITV